MKQYKLIIVENDEDERMFMNEGFQSSGLFEITNVVENGDELFSYMTHAEDKLPDVILSDLNMPGKNGYDIISEIRSNPLWSHIPVIITSTSSTKTIIDRCLNMGASSYLIKPDTFIEYGPFAHQLYNLIVKEKMVKT
jgi:CheY-like chemotaxis protein